MLQRERETETDREWRRFVLDMIAAHPERARKLIPLLDRENADGGAPEEYEDLPADYVPVQEREGLPDLLRELQMFGAAVVDDGD